MHTIRRDEGNWEVLYQGREVLVAGSEGEAQAWVELACAAKAAKLEIAFAETVR